jgi:hypothetical protein
LHDAVLFASGKLNLAMGGPGYRDFKYTEAYAPIYEYTTPSAPELWRRSIYRFVVRTTPHRFMTTLDCPDPANLTPVRAQPGRQSQAESCVRCRSRAACLPLLSGKGGDRIGVSSGPRSCSSARDA